MSQATDFAENALIDHILRGQTLSLPANWFFGLMTTAPSDTGPGTEVSGGSYARVSVARSLANFAGTQGAGTTVASSGTGGQSSNNVAITFAAPTANWGTVVGVGLFDASTAGNMWFYAPLTTSRTINNGDGAPSFAAAQFTFTVA